LRSFTELPELAEFPEFPELPELPELKDAPGKLDPIGTTGTKRATTLSDSGRCSKKRAIPPRMVIPTTTGRIILNAGFMS
jgi:hypothetical protein